jgi:hypothetical protein
MRMGCPKASLILTDDDSTRGIPIAIGAGARPERPASSWRAPRARIARSWRGACE